MTLFLQQSWHRMFGSQFLTWKAGVKVLLPPIFTLSVLCPKLLENIPTGCGGNCPSARACLFLHKLHDAACQNSHCQCCLMPLKRQSGVNMHPSAPGWKNCTFKYKDSIRRYLVLASLGEDLQVTLPQGFPRTGPDNLVDWVFSAGSVASLPNILLFVAALLGIV